MVRSDLICVFYIQDILCCRSPVFWFYGSLAKSRKPSTLSCQDPCYQLLTETLWFNYPSLPSECIHPSIFPSTLPCMHDSLHWDMHDYLIAIRKEDSEMPTESFPWKKTYVKATLLPPFFTFFSLSKSKSDHLDPVSCLKQKEFRGTSDR